MRMTIEEARQIGTAMLKVDRDLFDKSLEAARKVDGMRQEDLGPMSLVLAVMGVSKVNPNDPGIERELGDALDLIDKAEKAWRLQQKAGRIH
jgi:hypothetical protein